VLVFLFLEIARRVNTSVPSLSTPSGMIPPHRKASASGSSNTIPPRLGRKLRKISSTATIHVLHRIFLPL